MADDSRQALDTALDQFRTLLTGVGAADLDRPVPCEGWQVHDVVDHVVHGLGNFAVMVRGGDVDWSRPPAPVAADPLPAFDAAAAGLRAAWEHPAEGVSPDMQCAELAVHTWDLSRGLGRDTAGLDPVVAERGLALMQASLKDEMRGDAFGPEQPAPEGADAYTRIAAFAGREV
jgi:uncharacterized protein (TIGR03086 family)